MDKKKKKIILIFVPIAIILLVIGILLGIRAHEVDNLRNAKPAKTIEQKIGEKIESYVMVSVALNYSCKNVQPRATRVDIVGNQATVYGTYTLTDNYNRKLSGTFKGTYNFEIDGDTVFVKGESDTEISTPR